MHVMNGGMIACLPISSRLLLFPLFKWNSLLCLCMQGRFERISLLERVDAGHHTHPYPHGQRRNHVHGYLFGGQQYFEAHPPHVPSNQGLCQQGGDQLGMYRHKSQYC